MDWSKAKTILIVAFLITNILLGIVLFLSERHVEITNNEGFIEDVTKLLNNNKIFIDTEIPREIPSLNTLTVEYEILDLHEINKNYFDGEGKIELKDEESKGIIYNNESILVKNNKDLIYENNNEEEKYTDLNEEQAKTIALEFLQNKNYDISDMFLYYVKNEKDSYRLQFSKMYKDRYLEKANTIIEVDRRGVKKLERTWLNFLDEGDRPIYISTAPKAILSLLSMEEVYGKTIKDISLCYYFEPVGLDYKDAKKGKAGPAWRISFDDGYKTIIDNYNR